MEKNFHWFQWIQRIKGIWLIMNWGQFKDSASHMCLAWAVVASWSLTQEVTVWQVWANFTVMTNIFVTEFRKDSNVSFCDNFLEEVKKYFAFS